jgi:hypothetical protein
VAKVLHEFPVTRSNFKNKEESPYKPEAFDSRLFVVIAHVSTHEELQGFTKAIKLLSKSLV